MAACLGDELAVLLEQPLRLVACLVGCLDRALDRQRRASSASWILLKANFFRTKNTIRKKMIVQIISPGMTLVSGLEAATTSIYLTSTKPRKPPTRP